MTRNDFLQQVVKAGWCAWDLKPNWVRVARQPKYTYTSGDNTNPINPMGLIDILVTPEGQINLMLPTRFIDMVPGLRGQLRHFRVIANDWAEAWSLVEMLYRHFAPLKRSFDDIVLLCMPAARLIPDDETFYIEHRGFKPKEWKLVEPIPDE